jgi:hypothetical protein
MLLKAYTSIKRVKVQSGYNATYKPFMFFWKFMRTFFKSYEKHTNVLCGKIQGFKLF